MTSQITIRKIYIATSWSNHELAESVTKELRERGHEVFLFCDFTNRPEGFDTFVFNGNAWTGKDLGKMDYIEFLKYPETQRAFRSDKAGLDWADTIILLQPARRSSHLEAGYGVGQGKDVFILGDLPLGEFDAMYGFVTGCFHLKDLYKLIAKLEASI